MSESIHPVLQIALKGAVALDASAGTGKTYSIALVYLRLVLSGVPVERILVTTFTEAAAAELRERLRNRLAEARDVLNGESTKDDNLKYAITEAKKIKAEEEFLRGRVETALSDFDLAPVCTIHGFCHRLLRDYALELGANPDGEIGSEDPRIARLVADFEARIADLGDNQRGGVKKPETRDLFSVARMIREYGLDAPAYKTLEQLLAEWGALAFQTLKSAKEEWDKQKDFINSGIMALVEGGKIQAGFLDNAETLGPSRWRKLTHSMKDIDELLMDTTARDLKFYSGCKRVFPDEMLASATEPAQAQADVKAFIAHYAFFKHWVTVQGLPGRKEEAYLRSYVNDLLNSVAGLKPGRNQLFSDLINSVFRSLENVNFVQAVRDSLDAVLVDECQDTDARQITIFRRLFADTKWLGAHKGNARCLVWVGDPKQSIYRFRGADIETYLGVKKDAQEYFLDENFRSDSPLVAAINALFKGPSGSGEVFHKDVGFKPVHSSRTARIALDGWGHALPAFCLHTWDAGQEPPSKTRALWLVLKDCATQIRNLLGSGMRVEDEGRTWHTIRPSDIAVLAATRKDLEIVRRNLTRMGIPSAYRTDSSVFLADEARDLGIILKALAVPRPSSLKGALLTPFFGFTLAEVAQIDDAAMDRYQERLASLAGRLKNEGFMAILSSLLREKVFERQVALVRLAAQPDGERVLTNIIHLGELLQAAWMNAHVRSAEALKGYLERAITRAGEGAEEDAAEEAKLRIETDSPAVILSTIHSAKGLQYPIVFLPTIWSQGNMRKAPCIVRHGAKGKVTMVLPGDSDWAQANTKETESLEAEHMRKLYVACTRAKHQVHAWWGRVKHSPWNVASTRAAFGRLLLQDPGGAESYTDPQCREAFESAMKRDPGATYEIILLDGIPAGCTGKPGALPDPTTGSQDGVTVTEAGWSRGNLPAEPLQSSYSALTKHDPEAHSGADEFDVPPSDGDGDTLPDETGIVKGEDILDPFRGGKVLGVRVHSALEAAMPGADKAGAEEIFVKALARDLPGLLKNRPKVAQAASSQGGAGDKIDYEDIARNLWHRVAGARIVGEITFDSLIGQPHIPEWEFLLPQMPTLSPSRLAAAMKSHGGSSPWGREDYYDRVADLGFKPLTGFFDGIVDLLACLPENRGWVVIDYKSNRLDGYSPRHLGEAMADCQYLLQALLYAVAVKRWLERAVKGWDYDKDFAGAAFMFLRGLKQDTHSGVWFMKPPKALVETVENDCFAKGRRTDERE